MKLLPNLIIAGVHKAGTTSLYGYLARHPQICASFTKEINYFTPLLFGRDLPEPEVYAGHFSHCVNEVFRMEASPRYFYGRERIAESIKSLSGDARVIVILRDPTDRLVSYFSRAVADSVLPGDSDFGEYISISVEKVDSVEHDPYSRGFREGIYIRYLESWQRVFGGHLKVVFFDDLRSRAPALTVGICNWLGLDGSCYEAQEFQAANKTLDYRNRALHRFVKNLYMKNEAFWRRNEALRKFARKAYNALNADEGRAPARIDDESLSRLRALYEPHNRELRAFLISNEYQLLPNWLN